MKAHLLVPALAVTLLHCVQGAPIPCATDPLNTYINDGNSFDCSLNSGALNIGFNDNPLPSYAGLSILAGNGGADPSAFTVVPGISNLDFQGTFSDNSVLLSTQTELVQFMMTAANPQTDLTSTTFHLDNPLTSDGGGLGLGSGIVIGQELVCVGGAFTSLPVGLVTSVVNGVLGTGVLGCDGTVLVGTAGAQSGPLNGITGLLSLPDLTGVGDSATIQLSPFNPSVIDVIKIQSLISVLGGSASTQGFGDSFASTQVPEPGPRILMLLGVGAIVLAARRARI